MATARFSAPVCLVRQAGLGVSADGAALLEQLPEIGAVICMANVQGLRHKKLLHAMGLLSFPPAPGLWAWTCNRPSQSPVLMLILWEVGSGRAAPGSTAGGAAAGRAGANSATAMARAASVSHDAALLGLSLLLSSLVLYVTEEFLDFDRLLALSDFADRVRLLHRAHDVGAGAGGTGDALCPDMPQLLWLLSAVQAGQRIVDPSDGGGSAGGDGGAGGGDGGDAIRSLGDLLEWRLRPELALGESPAARARVGAWRWG